MPNSQNHCRENRTGTADSGTGMGQEKVGKNFLNFQSFQV